MKRSTIYHYASTKTFTLYYIFFEPLTDNRYSYDDDHIALLLLITWTALRMFNEVLAMKVDSSNSLYTIIRLSMLSVLWWYYGLDRFVMLSLCHLLNLKNVSENVIFNYDRETSFIFAVNHATLIMLSLLSCYAS